MTNWGDRSMQRRTVLKLVAAGFLPGSGGLVQIGCQRSAHGLEFLSDAQFDLLDALTEVIIPSDEHSPGASAANVARYIDIVVADGSSQSQERWVSGLEAVSKLTEERFGRAFPECDIAQQDEIVAEMARNEETPSSEVERFFVRVKRATIDGYYTSQVGIHEEFGYKGNTALDEFSGCTHEGHTGLGIDNPSTSA